LLSWLKFQFYI